MRVSGEEQAEVSAPPSGPARRWIRRLFQLALTVLVTGFILHRVGLGLEDLRQLDTARWRPDPALLLSASILLFGAYVLAGVYWGRLVAEIGRGAAPPPTRAVRIHFTANLGRYVPGKVLQVAGLAILARRAGIGAPVAVGSAMVGQALTLAAAGVVGAFAFTGPPLARGFAGRPGGPWIALGIALLLGGAIAVPPLFARIVHLAARFTRQADLPPMKIGPTFGLRWGTLYVGLWILQITAFWLLARSVEVEAGLLEVGPPFAAAYLLGYLAVFAPAGLGVREGFLVAMLEPVLGGASALGLAVLARLWTMAVELVPALPLAALELGGSTLHE